MIYRISADFVMVLHFCFVLFAVFGGLLVLRRRWIIWLHIPAMIWGIVVQVFVLTCPLTVLENLFRDLGGETGYSGSCIEYYISLILYSGISYWVHWLLGLFVFVINLLVYYYVFIRRNKIT